MIASARAPLAVDQRVDHRVVLHVGEVETAEFLLEIVAIHRQGAHRGERQVVVARQRHGDRRVAAGLDDGAVETHVHALVALQLLQQDLAVGEQSVALGQAFLQGRPCLGGQPALGRLACRQAFQNAAHLDRTGDILAGHRAHPVAAPGLAQQAFLLEGTQGDAHRHARDLQAFGGGNLDDALAGGEFAGSDQLA